MSNRDLCAIERQWKTLTLSSNVLFDAQDFEKALANYRLALTSAELLNKHTADCLSLDVPFIQVYIISCNNLANTYVALDELEYADRMHKRVLYYLLHLQSNIQLDQDEIRTELKRAALSYLHFAKKIDMEQQKRIEFFSLFKQQLLDGE